MSRIYEALLRAELERTEGQEGALKDGKAPELFPTKPAPARDYPNTFSRSSLPANMPVLVPSRAREENWSPDFQRLQALGERGHVLEQFRTLRSRLQGFRSLNTLKTILVSSGRPQEGKSFVSINLAIMFARHKGERVLLIDGDMRRSSLHKILGTTHAPGLTEYLSSQASLEQVMQKARRGADNVPPPKGLASLTFIPAGEDADNAADLSGSPRFAELIQTVQPMFDWVIIDSSPVTLVSDSVNLARAADGVLLVARGGVTKFDIAQRAQAEFKSSKVLGFVLNAVPDASKGDGYYGYDSLEDAKPQSEAK